MATSNRVAEDPSLVQRAEAALVEDQQLDYDRPFVDKPRPPVAERFLAACRGGDRRSCWIAAQIGSGDTARAASALVHANCAAGDALSCRADPTSEGRSDDCGESVPSCKSSELRAECDRGLATSCERLAHYMDATTDYRAFATRVGALGVAACQANILDECKAASVFADDLHVVAFQQECTFRHDCLWIGNYYMHGHQRDDARDAFERQCQRGAQPEGACLEVGKHYLAGELPEPVAGRGRALVEWACARHPTLRKIDKACRQ